MASQRPSEVPNIGLLESLNFILIFLNIHYYLIYIKQWGEAHIIQNRCWLFYIICDIKYLLYTWSCAWEYLQTSTIVHLQIKKHYGNKLFKLVLLAKAYTNINILTLTWYLNWFLCSFLETISCLYLCTQKCLFPKAHGLIMHWHCWQKRERWQVNCYIITA